MIMIGREGEEMISDTEAMKAVKTLKRYCSEHLPDCSTCHFAIWYDDGDADCSFNVNTYPLDWEE